MFCIVLAILVTNNFAYFVRFWSQTIVHIFTRALRATRFRQRGGPGSIPGCSDFVFWSYVRARVRICCIVVNGYGRHNFAILCVLHTSVCVYV
jgi:hypothetical protein